MDTVGEEKSGFFGGSTKQSGRAQASELPAEHVGAAELLSAPSVIHKRPARDEIKSMPAELSSDDRAGANLGSPRQAQMAELPTGVAELSAEPRSDRTRPSKTASALNPGISPSRQTQNETLIAASELPTGAETEDLAQLKQEAVRLEERKKRLYELSQIEDEEESLKKRIAGLEGRS